MGVIPEHDSYDPATGAFSDKEDATIVAMQLISMFSRTFQDFLPASVQVEGKKGSYTVQMPRIHRHWHPMDTTARALAEEVKTCANLFDEIYERNVE